MRKQTLELLYSIGMCCMTSIMLITLYAAKIEWDMPKAMIIIILSLGGYAASAITFPWHLIKR